MKQGSQTVRAGSACHGDGPATGPARNRFINGRRVHGIVIPVVIIMVLMAFFPACCTADSPSLGGVALYPADDIWNVPVDTLPVDPRSADYIRIIGATGSLHPDFGAGLWDGHPIGIPYNIVGGAQPKQAVTFDYASESDPGPYPIPDTPLVEGGSDRHMLILDRDNAILYELFAAEKQSGGRWHAGSGAVFNLVGYSLRPAGWTSADAAGLPILPGLVRYDEVNSGAINHAIRFTAPSTQRAYVWPARHYASSLTDPQYPPMGQRFRLKSSFDTSGYSPQARVILDALKKYGMILADNGGAWFITGVPDERWNNEVLHTLSQVKGSDFEAVNSGSLMISPDSGRARVTGSPTPAPTGSSTPSITPTVSPTNGQGYSPLTLSQGWNFISIPKKLAAGSNTLAIFIGVDMAGHSVYQYDGETGNFIVGGPSDLLRPLNGIWIYSAAPVTIPLAYDSNPLQVPPSRSLSAGWNAIGFSGTTPATARNTLLSVQDSWTTLLGFDAQGQVYENAIFNDPGSGSDLSMLYPEKGYWVYMIAPGTLAGIG